MHVVFREAHGLEETETPVDLGQTPAELVVLSFSDSDLGAFAAGWRRGRMAGAMPELRLANLAALRHPVSVDTYIEQTLSGAQGILIRLIGGVPYWSYGLEQVHHLAREKGIAVAVLPADGREDTRLDAYSTLPRSTLRRLSHLCDGGGAAAAQAALAQLALASGLYAAPVRGAKPLAEVGAWTVEYGPCCPLINRFEQPLVVISFYRSYLVADDLAPIKRLSAALEAEGFAVLGLFVPSLKAPQAAAWLARQLRYLKPVAVVNATAFSGKSAAGVSPLDDAGVPVFQVALSTAPKRAWNEAERGLSPADLAMHVVLPEVDGRIFAGVISFKAPSARDDHLQFSRWRHAAHDEGCVAVARKVARWYALRKMKAKASKRIAYVLSSYPGKEWQMGHAVGLDAIGSARAMLIDQDVTDVALDDLPKAMRSANLWIADEIYQDLYKMLPAEMQRQITEVWGPSSEDPTYAQGGMNLKILNIGEHFLALQPERANILDRSESYHDLERVPRHSYIAFYLWLRHVAHIDALVHIGAHGTLEWLPGKSVALSPKCWPEALVGDLPIIYPFIVNDPGEAAQAKRRIAAVTLGHIPPPMRASAVPERLFRLEALLDEFSNADGLDPKRRNRLQGDIQAEAEALGLGRDLGIAPNADPAEALPKIDRFLCDIKDSQFGDGLHIYGRVPTDAIPSVAPIFDQSQSATAERAALQNALNGDFIAAGPAGSPYRGRLDVLPTGRNLFSTDPRAVPSRAAYAQGMRLAEELIRHHLQSVGEYPNGVIVDLWGSATMRTAGEEFAMALALIGVRPRWDAGSERVNGFEITPIAELEHPRIDISLRISGLFRDAFPNLPKLFEEAVKALSARDESRDWNPYIDTKAHHVFGPKPGHFGIGMDAQAESYGPEGRAAAGEAWLAASAWAYGGETAVLDEAGIADRVRQSDLFVHVQDLPETDLLLAADYARHEAGFVAAQYITGGQAQITHLDTTRPETPRARHLNEEIARVVRARASNPDWIAGMMRHGYRGAAEIAATLDHMGMFAHLADAVPAHLFDIYYEATLEQPEVAAFLQQENPAAFEAMQARFAALHAAGLWQTRRNSILAMLEAAQ